MLLSGRSGLVGTGPELSELRAKIARVAGSDANVLVIGPTGAGKELVARLIHRLSPRKNRELRTINCAALTESILEAELFGFARGSFTGAYREKQGKLEVADSGTIFLDEIGDMALTTQARVLRFMESGEIQSIGESSVRHIDVRVIAASNADLPKMLQQNSFRQDLYYRIRVLQIEVPPLKGHAGDIPELIRHFWELASSNGHRPPDISNQALVALMQHPWPGNVRELRNLVANLVLDNQGQPLSLEDVRRHLSLSAASLGTSPPAVAKPGELGLEDDLYDQMVCRGQSFWTVVYPPFMARELNQSQVRYIIARALIQSVGNYQSVTRLLNVGEGENQYKRFLNFLRKHGLNLPFMQYRTSRPAISQ